MGAYAIYANPKAELKTKDRADLLEAFLGALYVDKVSFVFIFFNYHTIPHLFNIEVILIVSLNN